MALVYFPVLCNFYGEELRKLNFGITATDQIIDTIIFLCSVFFLSHNYGEARFG
jgi:hypothetical protein